MNFCTILNDKHVLEYVVEYNVDLKTSLSTWHLPNIYPILYVLNKCFEIDYCTLDNTMTTIFVLSIFVREHESIQFLVLDFVLRSKSPSIGIYVYVMRIQRTHKSVYLLFSIQGNNENASSQNLEDSCLIQYSVFRFFLANRK